MTGYFIPSEDDNEDDEPFYCPKCLRVNVHTKMKIEVDQDDEDKLQCYRCGYKSHRGLQETDEDKEKYK